MLFIHYIHVIVIVMSSEFVISSVLMTLWVIYCIYFWFKKDSDAERIAFETRKAYIIKEWKEFIENQDRSETFAACLQELVSKVKKKKNAMRTVRFTLP